MTAHFAPRDTLADAAKVVVSAEIIAQATSEKVTVV